ncbi:serine protease snake-like isoform X2 [Anoplophora glabripennis]|uniref:serine protease snake-like isoform X2 n=1 Tax=Anoplophora glabripennis TaxID=217634 RepID=UPI0008752CE6|nr:serine protease snake-like isoform X2 [Anoplophora glabripennis]
MDYVWIILHILWSLSASFGVSIANQNYESTSNKTPGQLSKRKCLEYYPKPKYPILGIAGGNESLPKEFPHMAAIGYGDEDDIQWQCGGSLISKKFVLTAAHCLDNTADPPKYVRLGDLDLSTEEDDASPQNFDVLRTILHPSYNPPAKYHDIALLELNREVNFNEYASPACLTTEIELNQTSLIATGWGKTGFTDSSSNFLLKVDLDPVPHQQCIEKYGKQSKKDLPNGIVHDFQICAGTVKDKDTCQGDSGGPLQFKNEDRSFRVNVHNVIGVTSFGKACALSGAPGIYTRISNYIPWIEGIAWENEN